MAMITSLWGGLGKVGDWVVQWVGQQEQGGAGAAVKWVYSEAGCQPILARWGRIGLQQACHSCGDGLRGRHDVPGAWERDRH